MSTPASTKASTIRVDLAGRGYDIAIGPGLIDRAGELSRPLLAAPRVIVVSDQTVAPLYGARLAASFDKAGVRTTSITVPAGESSKEFGAFGRLMNELLDRRPDRKTTLVALGGGVVGDLAGFAAAVLLRGVDFIQVPTTLLAQVDSSVGGKTGINSAHGKNQIGAFHQPALVVADTALLDTLPAREFRAGYAEVVKYGLIGDAGFFAWLDANWRDVLAGGPAREHAIATSCRAKAITVANDERESGERALLNLGHTFGHALEAAAGFSERLLHGEAVAIGMALAFAFSARRGLLAPAEAARVERHLANVGLPTKPSDVAFEWPAADALMALMAQDKKARRGKLTLILARGIGASFFAPDADPGEVRSFLTEKLAER
jgi:3-dehydroquinate synthase